MESAVIAVDFDSTIAHYSGWKGVGVFGPPIQGVQWALGKLKEMGATIIVHTCRAETRLISAYLKENEIPYDYINFSPQNEKLKLSEKKIAADIYIDDRSLNFRGSWPDTFREAINFSPWERKYGTAALRS